MQLQSGVPQMDNQTDTAATVVKIAPQAVRLSVRQDAAVLQAPSDGGLTEHATPQPGASQLATEPPSHAAATQEAETVPSGIAAQAICNSSASVAPDARGCLDQQTVVCFLPEITAILPVRQCYSFF